MNVVDYLNDLLNEFNILLCCLKQGEQNFEKGYQLVKEIAHLIDKEPFYFVELKGEAIQFNIQQLQKMKDDLLQKYTL